MGGKVKTTIDIADGLLDSARAHAKAEGTTFRALVERGLREVLAKPVPEKPWRWEPVTFELHPEPGVEVDLTRFRGHLTSWEPKAPERSPSATFTTPYPAGVPS